MPGAPNRPPDLGPAPAPAAAPGDERVRRILRRLVPSKVALRLDLWKGNLPNDLFAPFDRADRAFDAGDFAAAETALDLLSVRFAEPRWPTLPMPFRELRVEIVQPQPPAWDPESKLDPAEREAHRTRRQADRQLALARGSLDWAKGHTVSVDDLLGHVDRAQAALAANGPGEGYWVEIDGLWSALRPRVAAPSTAAARRPAAAADAESTPSESA